MKRLLSSLAPLDPKWSEKTYLSTLTRGTRSSRPVGEALQHRALFELVMDLELNAQSYCITQTHVSRPNHGAVWVAAFLFFWLEESKQSGPNSAVSAGFLPLRHGGPSSHRVPLVMLCLCSQVQWCETVFVFWPGPCALYWRRRRWCVSLPSGAFESSIICYHGSNPSIVGRRPCVWHALHMAGVYTRPLYLVGSAVEGFHQNSSFGLRGFIWS